MKQSAKIKRLPELETKETPFVYEYKCTCGKDIVLHSAVEINKLSKCWSCIKK